MDTVLGGPLFFGPGAALFLGLSDEWSPYARVQVLASSPSRLRNLRIDTYTGTTAALSWKASPEKGITSYLVSYGPAATPRSRRLTVAAPHAVLTGIAPGTIVSVKAVNARGLEGWDWAKTIVGEPHAARITQ